MRPDSLRRLRSHSLVRGADAAATAARPTQGGSVGGDIRREHSYATDTPIAATPQV